MHSPTCFNVLVDDDKRAVRTVLPCVHHILLSDFLAVSPWRLTFICSGPQNPEHLLLFGAGNSGEYKYTDRETCTIYSPGGGKNVLTIGASSSGETRRPTTDEDGARRSPGDLDSVPGDIDTVAVFSSYGLMADGRIKPEVVATGDQVRCTGIKLMIRARVSLVAGRG